MLDSRLTRNARLGLVGSALLLSLGCGPAQPDDPIDLESARGGLFLEAGYVQGQFEMRIASMLDGTSRTTYHVKAGDEVYEVVLPEGTDIPEYDSFVRVPGELRDDGKWEGEELVVLAHPPEPLIDPMVRPPRRIGTVLVFWNEGTGLPNAQATESMFTGNRSTNVYYDEVSYGIETMAGKVFGPYQIDNPGGCNVDFISNQADQAMIEKGWDPSDYRQMAYYFPGGLGCGFAGLASVGSPDNPARNSWYSGSFGCTTRNQELGHNYGMGHSRAYDSCGAFDPAGPHPTWDQCNDIEYGHPYDPMGAGCGHMNIVQKQYMGWIEGCNVVTATSSGIYNLSATERPCNGTQALLFPSYDGEFYHLEYRNGEGQFVAGNGVLVNVAPQVMGFGPTGHVLRGLGAIGNGYLHQGDTFIDPMDTVSFTILEEHDTHAVIELVFPDGGDGAEPTCDDGAGAPIMDQGAIGAIDCMDMPHQPDETAPEVTITYPLDGEWIAPGSDFSIIAEATDDRQIIEVELYLDGESFNVLTQPPWEWPVTNIPEGTYEFGVVARDARFWTPSNAVTINVGEAPEPATSGADESTGEPPDSGDASDTDSDGDSTGGDTSGQVEPAGCACNGSGAGGGLPFGLMVLGLLWLRRRES